MNSIPGSKRLEEMPPQLLGIRMVQERKLLAVELLKIQPVSDKGTEILVPRASWSGFPPRGRPGRIAAAQAEARQETLQNNMYYIDYKT